ncbi:hypothetical protein F5Y03DRAFT_373038 [Xylaria venustula]|nr:hypothetical protein F5Y03DRAFT_373038 [Xylaria venustula]
MINIQRWVSFLSGVVLVRPSFLRRFFIFTYFLRKPPCRPLPKRLYLFAKMTNNFYAIAGKRRTCVVPIRCIPSIESCSSTFAS